MKFLTILLSFLLAFTVALGMTQFAHANEQTILLASDDKAEKAKKKKDKRVCRRIKVTGSRIKERICQKESEWKRQEEIARENVNQTFEESNRSLGSPDG